MTLALAASVAFGGVAAPSWLGFDGNAFAQSKREAKAKPEESGRLGNLNMARQLFAYGKQSGDARAMELAAEITESYKGTAATDGGPKRKGDAKAATGAGRMTAEGMRAAAKAADPAAAESTAKAKSAARDSEEQEYDYYQSLVGAGEEDIWSWDLIGGSYVEIGISGWSDADIDLYIVDGNGNLICSSESDSGEEYCSFWAPNDGSYEVIIYNNSEFETEYEIYWYV